MTKRLNSTVVVCSFFDMYWFYVSTQLNWNTSVWACFKQLWLSCSKQYKKWRHGPTWCWFKSISINYFFKPDISRKKCLISKRQTSLFPWKPQSILYFRTRVLLPICRCLKMITQQLWGLFQTSMLDPSENMLIVFNPLLDNLKS
jgi:hypothetical protein